MPGVLSENTLTPDIPALPDFNKGGGQSTETLNKRAVSNGRNGQMLV